ncbi:MAG TPA: hypothetical protein VK698_23925 [Kofleriaceae bacterium]|nr:hypothetical protein [Kofleriaceae bacterium]
MLTPAFYARYQVVPRPGWLTVARALFGANAALAGTRFCVEGTGRVPAGPVLFATNSTQQNDFLAFRWVAERAGRRCVTVAKAKNYHDAAMAFALRRLGVVPIASKGYLLLCDFTATIGRRPTDSEYRALREYLDHGASLPAGEPYATLTSRPRAIVGRRFEPAGAALRDHLRATYVASLGETVRLARVAVAAGQDVQIYPEGTVAPRLGRCRVGAVQLAWALGTPIVPVGLSACPRAFAGVTPFLRPGGAVTVRFGAPLALAPGFLPAAFRAFQPEDEAGARGVLERFTDERLMPAIDALLDPPFRHDPADPWAGKGTRAHL